MRCPRFVAQLRPSAVRVRIRSRSTSAKPPRTAIISRPVLVPVSAHGSATDRNCALASARRTPTSSKALPSLPPRPKCCAEPRCAPPRKDLPFPHTTGGLKGLVFTAQGGKAADAFPRIANELAVETCATWQQLIIATHFRLVARANVFIIFAFPLGHNRRNGAVPCELVHTHRRVLRLPWLSQQHAAGL